MASLEIKDITRDFGGLRALHSVTASLGEGEILGLIGPNGAGKTTLFNVISGFMRPTVGSIIWKGHDITKLRPDSIAPMGVVRTFQSLKVFRGMSVLENIMIAGHIASSAGVLDALVSTAMARKESALGKENARRVLDFVGLTHVSGELAKNLPYGLGRKLGVAIALTCSPQVLLLDEPAAGLNVDETADMADLVGRIRGQGTSVCLVEHDMHFLMGVVDRVIVLNAGKIIANGTPAEVQRNEEVIKVYLGEGRRGVKVRGR